MEKCQERAMLVWAQQRKEGKDSRVLGKGEKIKFYLHGLDRVFELDPIVINRVKSCSGFWHVILVATRSVHFLIRPRSKIGDWMCRSGKINPVMECDRHSIPIYEQGKEDR